MKKTIYCVLRCITAAMIVFGAVSCLEKYPEDAYREGEGMKTFSDAEQHLMGIYSAFMSGALYSGYLTLVPDIQADLVHAVDGYSNTYGSHWLWDIKTTDPQVEGVYAALYSVIGRCNFFLDKVGDVKASLTDDDHIEALDCYTGEVYCARALAYLELVKTFCAAYRPETAKNELGVVLADRYYNHGTAKRASLKESYQFILDDLAKAEELMDEEDNGYNNVWLSLAAAYAIHARTALYMEDWETAADYSGRLIADKDFELADARRYTSTADQGQRSYYQYMWDYDFGYEVIWMVGFTQTSMGGALGSVFLNYTTDYTYYYPDYIPSDSVLALYTESDQRASNFYMFQTGYAHGMKAPLLVKYYGNREFMQSRIYHVNMPKVLRLAEQYLISAEAKCNLGDFSGASKDLTALRQARFTKGGNISLTEENWLEQISQERVRELYMEGFRLHDLKRWNKGFERKPQQNTLKEGSSLKIEAGDYRFVWPIPRHEIESPGTDIVQNPGY